MRLLYSSNPVRLAVLVWFAGWLLVVMPGHKRGIVQLPDAQAAMQAAQQSQEEQASCCKPKPPSCCDSETEADTNCEQGPLDPAKHCAICFLKAHLTDAPPAILYTPYLGELDELAYLAEPSIANEMAAPTQLRGRAPPA